MSIHKLYFCRLKMKTLEKITKEIIDEFIRTNEIRLSSTHTRLCLPVIDRIFKKMSGGIKFAGIKVENNVICDGHHRYIASLLANLQIEILPGNTTSATSVIDWKSVNFVEDDWDTEAKIRVLNEQDAEFNNISLDTVVELLK